MRIRRYIDINDVREGDVLCIGGKDIDKQNSHFITVSKIIKNYYDNDVYCIFVYFIPSVLFPITVFTILQSDEV